MADVHAPVAARLSPTLNVADRLSRFAAVMPDVLAVVCPVRNSRRSINRCTGASGNVYATITFAELNATATRLARGLVAWGVQPETRLALLVRPGIDFVALVFAMLRAGVTIVLIDPGLGRRNLVKCLAEVEPEGFIAIPVAQAARLALRRRFPRARWNVTVGRRWLWGGLTLEQLAERGDAACNVASPATHADDAAAIIFTSGSTGPPKGVLYTQRMFDTQVAEIQSMYGIQPGGVDLSCFPLFALFNSAMGVTTVLPQMDFSRPASAKPKKLLAAANDWKVTQAFASPAVWRNLGAHCCRTGERIPTLRQIYSCGAPVTSDVLRSTLAIAAQGAKMNTPYGATECLPVATMEAADVLGETAALTDAGAGVCVGRPFESIEWRVIQIRDEPLATLADAEELPAGEIGELIVRGPQASPRYVTRSECNAEAKIADGDTFWHRMGDVGYLDDAGRFWYCGRKSHRVETIHGPLYTECVEAIFNRHPDVAKTALVGLGDSGEQIPYVFFEPVTEGARDEDDIAAELLEMAQQFEHTRDIRYFSQFEIIPVDVRHNSKIRREVLADWAEGIDLLYLLGLKPRR
jgi:olefin beta-lactone synthetase